VQKCKSAKETSINSLALKIIISHDSAKVKSATVKKTGRGKGKEINQDNESAKVR